MLMVIFLMGLCLGGLVVLVGLSVIISRLTRSTTKEPQTNPKHAYDDIIARFHQDSAQSLSAFCERLNQANQKGNHS
jgi:hypothetical protein